MPIYEYVCEDCGMEHEIVQKITDEPLSVCPVCAGAMKKKISSTSFVLKGTGWYVTDYASKDKKQGSDPDPKPAAEPVKTSAAE
ncbi:MAG: zinc ribbon domain-containing protein [Dissulfurispiraceae bacterium]|jgi:putative FmdB family regulatory protein|nr:zinc ribbon domain-containing protein [Dissulfurispiraceae bacterium]